MPNPVSSTHVPEAMAACERALERLRAMLAHPTHDPRARAEAIEAALRDVQEATERLERASREA